jgi:hypothetical protein
MKLPVRQLVFHLFVWKYIENVIFGIGNRQRIIDEQRPALRHNRTPQEGGVFSVLAITENEVIPRYTSVTRIFYKNNMIHSTNAPG